MTVWYWPVFLLAVIVWIAVPLVARWEARQDRRDRELWAELPGSTR